MSKYRKKPVVVDAFKWTGAHDQKEDPEWICEAIEKGHVWFDHPGTSLVTMNISTLEGVMRACVGDYIIKGIKGEIYPCKPDIFEASYDIILS